MKSLNEKITVELFSMNLSRIVSLSSVPILNLSSPQSTSVCKNLPNRDSFET